MNEMQGKKDYKTGLYFVLTWIGIIIFTFGQFKELKAK